jgi:hypothetical protein
MDSVVKQTINYWTHPSDIQRHSTSFNCFVRKRQTRSQLKLKKDHVLKLISNIHEYVSSTMAHAMEGGTVNNMPTD